MSEKDEAVKPRLSSSIFGENGENVGEKGRRPRIPRGNVELGLDAVRLGDEPLSISINVNHRYGPGKLQ